MIRAQSDEEFGPFGKSAVTLLNLLFPDLYRFLIIVSPSFGSTGESNIAPQFERGDFFILPSAEKMENIGECSSDLGRYSPSHDVDEMLDSYRYRHAILASADLSILTAWAQAEYAVIAFRGTLLDEYAEWFEAMQALAVVRRLP